MIQIINEIPAIYYEYQKAFGPSVDWDKGCIIAYDKKIYVNAKWTLQADEIEHEETHLKQQEKYGLDVWVEKYLTDPKFRLEMEIEAYKAQCNYMRNFPIYSNQERLFRINKLAEFLSSPMYGSIISYNAAKLLLIK